MPKIKGPHSSIKIWQKHKKFHRNYYIVFISIIGLIASLMSYDAIRLRFILKDHPEIEIPLVLSTKSQFTESEKICEYIDVLHEAINEPDEDDDIQKNIGYQNNKVGLYIYAEVSDYIDIADELANSNGGEWGYVLLPYNVKDYNQDRWGRLFAKLSDEHLIPIVQLWDLDLDDSKETDKQIRESALFLNSLKWPIKPRYVSVYNETNDSSFWKGEVNPEEYAEILEKTINQLNKVEKRGRYKN